jgi:metallo-beta-lactamase family protein
VIESTYGDRRHSNNDPADMLARVITSTVRRRSIVLIPVFAVGRAQTVLHLLPAFDVTAASPPCRHS